MLIREITSFLDSQIPLSYQESYDNSGFLLGDGDIECSGVVVAIDLTQNVIDEAVSYGFNMIVTHHPFIFGGLKRITTDSETGRMVYSLISNHIAVYAAHTNLDNMKDGVNGILAKKMGLENVSILRQQHGMDDVGSGLIGSLKRPTSIDAFLSYVKSITGIPFIRTSLFENRLVQKVAICGGSGAFLINDAIEANADIYITSDLKYHDFQKSENHIVVADIGHYESEQFAKELIYSIISRKFSTFACRISDSSNSYVRYI